MRKTKIVATIGPSSQDAAVLESMVEAGLDVVRLNFSWCICRASSRWLMHQGHREEIRKASWYYC